jgi:hypothetical protein
MPSPFSQPSSIPQPILRAKRKLTVVSQSYADSISENSFEATTGKEEDEEQHSHGHGAAGGDERG